MTKTRNTKVKANTIIAQVQKIGDEARDSMSPAKRGTTTNLQTALFSKVQTHRSRQKKDIM